jgi:hypothetical protein
MKLFISIVLLLWFLFVQILASPPKGCTLTKRCESCGSEEMVSYCYYDCCVVLLDIENLIQGESYCKSTGSRLQYTCRQQVFDADKASELMKRDDSLDTDDIDNETTTLIDETRSKSTTTFQLFESCVQTDAISNVYIFEVKT